jgi:urease accessory protein
MERSGKASVAATSVVSILLARQPAFAHHVMGGETPATAWHGLLSGLGHPIIGVDHLAFVVAVGLIAGTIMGCIAQVLGFSFPFSELAIASTLFAVAITLAMRLQIPVGVLVIFFAMAGPFHGYAYGESIIGAEPAPLAAYLTGFAVVQYCIGVGAAAALHFVVGKGYLTEPTALRAAGGVIALVAAIALVNSVIGA